MYGKYLYVRRAVSFAYPLYSDLNAMYLRAAPQKSLSDIESNSQQIVGDAEANALLKGSKGTPRKGWEEFYRV